MEGKKRAWIYCRACALNNSFISLEEQKVELYDYAKKMDFTIVGIFQDLGSGIDMNRPSLLKIMKVAEEEKIDVILVKKIDRLGRSMKIVDFIFKLEQLGIKLHSPENGEISMVKKSMDLYKEDDMEKTSKGISNIKR